MLFSVGLNFQQILQLDSHNHALYYVNTHRIIELIKL